MRCLWDLREHLPSGCILWLEEEEGAQGHLSRRVLALQCLCLGLSQRRRDPVKDSFTDVHLS
jgi:hypothetical protein